MNSKYSTAKAKTSLGQFFIEMITMTENISLSKEIRQENLLTLKRAIIDGSFEELAKGNTEWGGAYVIISSSAEFIERHKNEAEETYVNSQDTYVLTQHSIILSNLFDYVKENIMKGRDFYLYGFMALLANDFIRQFGDAEDYTLILEYVVEGISFYCKFNDWECGMDSNLAFEIMRFFLSEQISTSEIKHIL